MGVDLGYLSRHGEHLPRELSEGLVELRNRVRGTEHNLRQIVRGIFPSVLTDLGLIPALRSFLEEAAGRPTDAAHPLEMELLASGLEDGRLPEDVEIAVYRVIQQGVTNAIQHAHAKRLRVELSWLDSELTVDIADDGVGFDIDHLQQTPASGHFGLVNMKDRIEALGGWIEIESKPSRGTSIRASVPTPSSMSRSGQLQRAVYILAQRDTRP